MDYNILVTQGASLSLRITVQEEDGNPANFSGSTLAGQVKYRLGETGVLINLSPTIYNASSGQLTISLPATGTSTYPVGMFFYDVFQTSGALVRPIVTGKFNITPSVFI